MLLSGGLDSPTVAVVALDLLTEHAGTAPLLSFTSVPQPEWDSRIRGEQIGDEGPLVHILREQYPALDTRFVAATGLDADDVLMRMSEYAEVPVHSPGNQHWLHECRRLSRAGRQTHDVDRHLGERHAQLYGLPVSCVAAANRPVADVMARSGIVEAGMAQTAAPPRVRCSPAFPVPAAQPGLRRRQRPPSLVPPQSHPEFARHVRLAERIRAAGIGPYSWGIRSCREGQIRILYNPYRLGTGRSTRLALRTIHDVVDRDPLGNRRFVEWCLGLPDEQYLHRGQSRRLVRRLMEGRLPAEVLAGIPGRQGADWHLRLSRNLPHIRHTFEDWCSDPEVAGRIDLDRLLRLLDTWPARTPLSPVDHPDYLLAQYGTDGALATGHFIRWTHGGGV